MHRNWRSYEVQDEPVTTEQITALTLEGKYSLESTDPRESETRAHLRP